MVAYSFNPIFGDQVSELRKLQTVRADRRRHAAPGERIQLYTGMRTRHCRKLVDPDPVCKSVVPITILLVGSPHLDFIGSIVVDGERLHLEEMEAFAKADGFAIEHVGDWKHRALGIPGSARFNMGMFWKEHHGDGVFHGWLIRWEPAP
ncbi:hypothetical protein [Mesorhizobium australicum]|uniref:ASCH domain-containing protein n=1 Tax=Mesorhizobium australicum TaxID=536018 RepID=A0A1X7NVN2_9HYPH|nr:hypothetical protein [Mesorhizobium australicum]SMH42242.1 hypothetical protein SAMN02982922_2723 [Mesorhizobium australicum]